MKTASARPADAATVTSPAIQPRISRRRLWLFRISAAVVVPAVLLGSIELGLRLFGVGYDTSYFIPAPGRDALTGNPRFGWRFFPRRVARMPQPFVLPKKKAPGTYRIFVLGSSAALGFPDPSFSFSRILEAMLRDRFPKERFEVINTAMVAINSHAVLPIARECLEHEPDLLILYEGNNEVVGPYGAGTVFGGLSPALWIIRAKLLAKATRIGQTIEGMVEGSSAKRGEFTEWKGMEFFLDHPVATDDPRLAKVYDYFGSNLRDIANAARAAGVPLLMCTVGVNLADCPPFGSRHRANLSEADRARWDALVEEGKRLQSGGDAAGAIEKYKAAAKIDDQYAELPYRIGECMLSSKQIDDARRAFGAARDLDVLRFRTDSRSNDIITQAAKADPNVTLIDVAQRLSDDSASHGHVTGNDLFHEHVHLNFAGNYLIARALFGEVVRRLPTGARDSSGASLDPPSMDRCAEQLAYTDWDRRSIANAVVSLVERPPFTGQLDHEKRLESARKAAAKAASEASPAGVLRATERYRVALEQRPDDVSMRRKYATLLIQGGNRPAAEAELRRIVDAVPWDAPSKRDLAGLAAGSGRTREALDGYAALLESPWCDRQCQGLTLFNRGVVEDRAGQIREALASYRAAAELSPNDPRILTNLGLVLSKTGDMDGAAAMHRRVISLAPADFRGHLNLALVAQRQGRIDEAEHEFREAARISPNEAIVRLALGTLLHGAGRFAEALPEFDAAARLAPTSADAQNGMGECLMKLGRTKEAIAAFETAVRLKPDHAAAMKNLAAAKRQVTRNVRENDALMRSDDEFCSSSHRPMLRRADAIHLSITSYSLFLRRVACFRTAHPGNSLPDFAHKALASGSRNWYKNEVLKDSCV